jgi:RNA-directed DNA polymerase
MIEFSYPTGRSEAGETWVVDVDLDRFFDRVQHDALVARVARRVGDRRVLRLIRRYLDAASRRGRVRRAPLGSGA